MISNLPPQAQVARFILASAFAWTLTPALVHLAPPIDVVESAMWGPEWVIGTYKHPAMPAWVIEIGRRATGTLGWPVYLASQLFVAATLWLTYCIGRDLMDAPRGAAAALSLAGVEYVSWASPNFNHNIAEMPFWVAAIWLAWRAADTGSRRAWIGLGAVAAAGLYAKFSLAVILLVIAIWLLADARARRTLATAGPWLALTTFLIGAFPLARWLIGNDFGPLGYASARAGDSLASQLAFLPRVALSGLPIVAVLALAGLLGRIWHPLGPRAPAPVPAPVDDRAHRFLLWMALGPPLLVLAGAILTRTGLRGSWGAPMLALPAVLAIAWTSRRFDRLALAIVARCAMVLAVAVPFAYAVIVSTLLRPETRPSRVNWPQTAIAAELRSAWARETSGAQLLIIAGDTWIAGLGGIGADQPSILTDGDMRRSPWITPERLQRQGALVVWEQVSRGKPPGLDALIAGRTVHEARVPWPRARAAPDLVVYYAIIPPAARTAK